MTEAQDEQDLMDFLCALEDAEDATPAWKQAAVRGYQLRLIARYRFGAPRADELVAAAEARQYIAWHEFPRGELTEKGRAAAIAHRANRR